MRRADAREAPLFLVGFMGAGKSAVGGALARRLSWDFADTDAIVEQAEGRSIEAIFRESGEGGFRELEWEALRSLAGRSRTVVATGGGLFLGVAPRAFIREQGLSLWLDVPLAVIEARLSQETTRPVWTKLAGWERWALFERRRAAYALSDVTLHGADDDVQTLARHGETRWRSLFR